VFRSADGDGAEGSIDGVRGGGVNWVHGVHGDRINSEGNLRDGGSDGMLDRVGEGECSKVEGVGGILGREENSRSATASPSFNNSMTQRCFLVCLAGGGFIEGGEGAGGEV
jgi:hypothetical protein